MKKVESDWNVYRTRFLVKAKQLTESMAFVDPLGREHHGHKGDYLMESYEGVRRIVPQKFFEDAYVSIHSDSDAKVPQSKKRPARVAISVATSSRKAERIQPIA